MVQKHVTVGIVGGGVAGLTLARMLEMANVSYILYEAYPEITPNSGASLGLMPNGLRILDQLGVIDQIEAFSVTHDRWEHRDADSGTVHTTSTAMRAYPTIFGYSGFFMARQDVLKILFDSLEDKSSIYTSKRVVSIENHGDREIVTAADGDSFTCNIVAGADGVRSIVRQHILGHNNHQPSDYLLAHTTCVFGMSPPVPQISPGRHFTLYNRKVSALVFSGISGKLYWFLFHELDEPLVFGPRVKFDAADIDAVYEKIADAIVTDDVRIADVFKSKEVAFMTALEEGLSNTWSAGRLFLLGDSVHKMVPHAAMGANQAMESAACFLNNLRSLQNNEIDWVGDELKVQQCLTAYGNQRRDRLSAIIQAATMTCKNQLLSGPSATDYIRNLPKQKDAAFLVKAIESLRQAEKLENWSHGSHRVVLYDELSAKALELLSNTGNVCSLDSIAAARSNPAHVQEGL